MFADPDGPKIAKAFEMQGRVTRIGLKKGKILVCQRSNFGGQRFVQRPKPWGGEVPIFHPQYPAPLARLSNCLESRT
jgi:hypothetical protein